MPETMFAHNLHTFACGVAEPSTTWGKHIFSPGCLPPGSRAQVHRDQARKTLPSFGLDPPLRHLFLHPSTHCGNRITSQPAGSVSQLGSLDSPSPDSATHLLCDLTSHFSSQCLYLPLYQSRVYRRLGSGGCVPEEVSCHSFIHSFDSMHCVLTMYQYPLFWNEQNPP